MRNLMLLSVIFLSSFSFAGGYDNECKNVSVKVCEGQKAIVVKKFTKKKVSRKTKPAIVEKVVYVERTVTVEKIVENKTKKNSLILEARNDFKGLSTKVENSPGSKKAITESKKGLVLGLNYYRRQVLDSAIGLGVGIDTNSTLKGMVGLDF